MSIKPSVKLKKPSNNKKPTIRVDKNKNNHSFFNTDFSTVIGRIIAVTPRTKPILKMFEPNAFPILISG